jgi:hypothetical protein
MPAPSPHCAHCISCMSALEIDGALMRRAESLRRQSDELHRASPAVGDERVWCPARLLAR